MLLFISNKPVKMSAVMDYKEKQRRNNVALTFHLTPGVHGLKLTNGSFSGEVNFFLYSYPPPIVHCEVRTLHRY